MARAEAMSTGKTADTGRPLVTFDAHPDRYAHWKVGYDGPVATLTMDVAEDRPLVPGYTLKLNSYDLGVDIELADALQRIRFEHPEVKSVIVTSATSLSSTSSGKPETSRPQRARMRLVSSTRPPASMTSTRAAMRISSVPYLGCGRMSQ